MIHSNNCKHKVSTASNSNQAQKMFHSIGPGVIGEDLKDPNSIQKHWNSWVGRLQSKWQPCTPSLFSCSKTEQKVVPAKRWWCQITRQLARWGPHLSLVLFYFVLVALEMRRLNLRRRFSTNSTCGFKQPHNCFFHLSCQEPLETQHVETQTLSVFCVSLSKMVIVMNLRWRERIV